MRAILLGAALVAASGLALAQEVSIDFEDGTVGQPPSAFTIGLTGGGPEVGWAVAEDPTAPAGPKVVTETSVDRTSYRFPLAILDGFSAADVTVTVQFKAIAGEVDQAAGLMVRVRDPDNYYIARANALEGNVRLYKIVGGQREQFAGVDIDVPRDQWQELGLTVDGDQFSVTLDGRELFTAADSTFAEAGSVGLWTKADSLTHFDAFTATPLP